jgi:Domain of unknown function (DUF4105)
MATDRSSFSLIRRIARGTGLTLLVLLMLGVSSWEVLALCYWDHAAVVLCHTLAAALALVALALLIGFLLPRWRWRSLVTFLALFALVLTAWSTIEPSNERDWQTENALLPYATIDGERITLHNIRNFDYRSESDFTPSYYDRTFELRQLEAVDLFAVYWMGPAIAHVFLSFGFRDGSHVAVSIEARREKGQGYSSVQGFFRQYPLYFAVGDERDLVRLRTNYRHDPPEQVYLYRLRGSGASEQALFRAYLEKLNALRQHPEWYNTLTSNCTNSIWFLLRFLPGHLRYSWKILASGYLPEYLYEQGRLDTSEPFAELQRRAYINPRAQRADGAADFSQRIRAR